MRLLIVLAQYHPALNPNVYRWSAIARQWIAQGHEVEVLCTRRSGLPDESVLDGVRVHRAGENSLLDWAYNFLSITRRRGEAGGDHPARHGRLRKWLEKVVDVTWRSIYWPDGRCLWYFPGKRKALQLLAERDFDGMISVGAPFTAHLIGLACKRAAPDLVWLTDIEDPFAFVEEYFINNRALYRRLNFRMEKRVLERADAIAVTVDTAKAAYAHHFPSVADKITVVPPLYDPEVKASTAFAGFDPARLHLCYLGAFYAPIRTPDAALALLDLLLERHSQFRDRLVIHFFGEIEYAVKAAFEQYPHLSQHLQLHGLVTRETVAAVVQQTDFLLNIGNTTFYNLPSKSADYLACGKPIVHVSASSPDTFLAFMAGHPMLFSEHADRIDAASADRLAQFLTTFQGCQVEAEVSERLIKPYRVEVVAAGYLGLITGKSSS